MSRFTLHEWIQQIETEIAASKVQNHFFRKEIANGTVSGIKIEMIEKGIQKLEWLKELQRHKDLEEQGRFQELLCKPGDKVWIIDVDYDIAGYLFMGMCGNYAIVCSTYTWCETFEEQLECMVEETIEDGDTHVELFHKNHVFLTKAEAEARLTEIQKGE